MRVNIRKPCKSLPTAMVATVFFLKKNTVATNGIDLIPYADARGRPPDRNDELIAG